MELLTPTETMTHSPFKGDAGYFSFGEHNDVAGVMSSHWKAWSRLKEIWLFMLLVDFYERF
ncbi:hypothetical protein ACGTNG_02525 [Halomonas sp. 1390]|uniref:hypothetical protein n=1 Tax=Halomonas sp. B23F22_3 TaxID=3459516 RepID=UPI00373F4343